LFISRGHLHDLEVYVKGHSRSLETNWTDHTRLIIKQVIGRDLEMWVRVHPMSLKLVPFESLGAVSYSHSLVTMTVSVAVCEIFSVKEWRDLENQVRVVQGH